MALRVLAKHLITSTRVVCSGYHPVLLGPVQKYALSTTSVRYLNVQDLEKAKSALSALKEDPGNDIKLKLYGFYKQVRCLAAVLWRFSFPFAGYCWAL